MLFVYLLSLLREKEENIEQIVFLIIGKREEMIWLMIVFNK